MKKNKISYPEGAYNEGRDGGRETQEKCAHNDMGQN